MTDANLLLGRLDPAYFLGGRMSLDLPRTERLAKAFAAKLGLDMPGLAEGIVRVANANMERAMRVVSVERGFDPRDFALLAFGGAGGLHACDLAVSLEISTVLVPEHSGVLSALGMLLADVAKDYSASVLRDSAQLTGDALRARLAPLTRRARSDLAEEGFAPGEITLAASLAMRYRGQAFEIDVPLSLDFFDIPIEALAADFHRRHAKLYSYSNPQRATEAVQLRLRAIGRTAKPPFPMTEDVAIRALPEPDARRMALFSRRRLPTPVFHRGRLTPGMGGLGPAIIVTGESTNIVPPGWAWRIDGAGTLVAAQEDAAPKRGGRRAL